MTPSTMPSGMPDLFPQGTSLSQLGIFSVLLLWFIKVHGGDVLTWITSRNRDPMPQTVSNGSAAAALTQVQMIQQTLERMESRQCEAIEESQNRMISKMEEDRRYWTAYLDADRKSRDEIMTQMIAAINRGACRAEPHNA